VPKHGLPDAVRRALADCALETGPGAPEIDPNWGEPGLTGPEKVFGWCALEILAMEAGTPKTPVNAIPPRAWARLQLRFVVDVDMHDIVPAVRRHLDRHGFSYVEVAPAREEVFPATRLDPENPWVGWALASIERSTGKKPALLPNLGGSLPNDAFSEILALPTIWIPHSYPGCSQHAPNEHVPASLFREALGLMAGLYWDAGESAPQGR
jgi:acetylornithine deacetylase/succinyl-diaminopimelate desuccinylase-like protein